MLTAPCNPYFDKGDKVRIMKVTELQCDIVGKEKFRDVGVPRY